MKGINTSTCILQLSLFALLRVGCVQCFKFLQQRQTRMKQLCSCLTLTLDVCSTTEVMADRNMLL